MLIRPIHHELAGWQRLAMMALAVLLGLALATAVGATDVQKTPLPLPAEIDDWARPMDPQDLATIFETKELGCEIWRVLELHQRQNHAAAIDAWNKLNVPDETAIWKWLALGAASTAIGQFEKADGYLDRGIKLHPDNALAYYLRGVLRMQQSLVAYDWPDTSTKTNTRLVALKPQPVVPNTRGMYELAATMDFELAIQLASTLNLDESIIPVGLPSKCALEPTVGDLALALQADNFVAKAHVALGTLFLKRGALELAEQHLDEASIGSLNVVLGYCDLGTEYLARRQIANSLRAYLKSIKFIADEKYGHD